VPDRGMNAEALLHGYRDDIGFLGTSGMFIKRALFEKIEGFDTFYDPTCFEDTDICFQIKKAGFAVAFRDLAGIRHQPHQTTGASAASERYTRLFNRNADYFRKKWMDYPDFFIDYIA
jgi:GT2 family glycosyltransferase